MKNQKKYVVTISEKFGDQFLVTAKDSEEAKKIAWNQFRNRIKKVNYNIIADRA